MNTISQTSAVLRPSLGNMQEYFHNRDDTATPPTQPSLHDVCGHEVWCPPFQDPMISISWVQRDSTARVLQLEDESCLDTRAGAMDGRAALETESVTVVAMGS